MTLAQFTFFMFAAVAAGGVLIAALAAVRIRVSPKLGAGHGLAALAALALLLLANLTGVTGALAWWAFGVLAAGLVGGGLLFRVLFKGRPPMKMVGMHAGVGSLGLLLLYLSAF